MQHEIHIYQTEDGRIPYEEYMDALRDRQAKLLIARRVQRAAVGNFGDHHSLDGGLHEMRLDYGPGYRVYYMYHGRAVVILLLAGDKSTQTADIKKARAYQADFKRRNA
ncbi:type II toxin-antitoxin system RelE/ParE family toxin [uncultured Mailhella sp.]|uniref:type II toxin-antitoxin system RelE/ParE family toxin n=1 Tax=uncultured Mailhella sp. TaxID=1981031 RepID=UPI0025FD3B56|nr:type II toxin-antitoxin system RelE/ParE family toxin [uncultured Mailhella sp.]